MTRNHALALSALVAAAATAALPAAVLLAQPVPGAFTVVETGRSYRTLQDAVSDIGNTRATIRIAPGTYRQCAVQQAGVIVYEAPQPGSVTFIARSCEGKAAFVLRGIGAEIRGITFSNMRVPDGNGAGIRLEKGALNVAYARFENSQQGILSAANPSMRVYITRSTFTGLGTCENDAGCAHSLYIGDVGSLTVRESRFERGTGGHYLKSRAARVEIAASSFDDSAGRGTNYMIDLPAGATGQITNNWFVQGPDHENHSALIAVAAEERKNSSDGLVIAGNDARLAPKVPWSTVFVADWSGNRLEIGQNTLGPGIKRFEKR